MAAVTVHSDSEAQENKVCPCCFPIYLPWSDLSKAVTQVIFLHEALWDISTHIPYLHVHSPLLLTKPWAPGHILSSPAQVTTFKHKKLFINERMREREDHTIISVYLGEGLVLKKTLENPLDCKEIQPVHPKGHQSWIFIGRTDAEVESPILWPPEAKNWLIWKDPDAGKDGGQEEMRMTEDEMMGWHHWLNGHEFEQPLGVDDGQGRLACCSPWSHKKLDTLSDWTESIKSIF